jgi:hypothetical protein
MYQRFVSDLPNFVGLQMKAFTFDGQALGFEEESVRDRPHTHPKKHH